MRAKNKMATKTKPKKSPSKSTSHKSQKKSAQDQRTTNIAIGVVGILFIAGIMYAMFGTNALTEGGGGHSSEVEAALTTGPMAQVLQETDITRPLYEADKPHKIIVYVGNSWSGASHDEQVRRTNKIGEAWQNVVTEHFGKQTDTEVMVHTPNEQMIGTWYPSEGGKIQQ